MPTKPAKVCSWPGCSHSTTGRHCRQHAQAARSRDRERGTAAERGYDARWQRAREAYLKGNPLCVYCQRENRVTAATVVDHVTPHRGDEGLFWDRGNWQALCKKHHDHKTATEDGGFGAPQRRAQ